MTFGLVFDHEVKHLAWRMTPNVQATLKCENQISDQTKQIYALFQSMSFHHAYFKTWSEKETGALEVAMTYFLTPMDCDLFGQFKIVYGPERSQEP